MFVLDVALHFGEKQVMELGQIFWCSDRKCLVDGRFLHTDSQPGLAKKVPPAIALEVMNNDSADIPTERQNGIIKSLKPKCAPQEKDSLLMILGQFSRKICKLSLLQSIC